MMGKPLEIKLYECDVCERLVGERVVKFIRLKDGDKVVQTIKVCPKCFEKHFADIVEEG